jgi:hypothetical protein
MAISKDEDFPFIDVGFYIDILGKPSGYFINYFSYWKDSLRNNYEKQLFKIAVVELKKYPFWIPGLIKGHKVITEHNVRVYFDR